MLNVNLEARGAELMCAAGSNAEGMHAEAICCHVL